MSEVEKLENQDISNLAEYKENVFLIDWLTVTCHGCTVDDVKQLIGMDSSDIPWEITERFMNGYPLRCYWNGVTIYYGADEERYYKDPTKARTDMGICLNFSGKGCRAFETYGHGDWFKLLSEFFTLRDSGRREKKGRTYSYNITRLDLAYDDHEGLLNMQRMERDIRQRNYVSKSKNSKITWSDDRYDDIQGLSLEVGSMKSAVFIRIYDKAAERGFKDRHWIRVELQLRDDRACAAADQLVQRMNIGETVSGILLNYFTFREPTEDSNTSRWPIADYWQAILTAMQRIRLWVSPGEPYNFSNTEHWLQKQYGQAIVVMDMIHDPYYLIDKCKRLYPVDELAPKYKNLLKEVTPRKKPFDYIDDPVDVFEDLEDSQLSYFVEVDPNEKFESFKE